MASNHNGARRWAVAFAVVMLLGTALNAVDCFHGQLWFDESYSTALAAHSFADIWRIGSADVHPVLYYCMLHVVYLLFGANLTAYRLFSLLGAVVLALLGWTHVRRDSDERTGVLFAFFALFSPWGIVESSDIRMYSWAAVFVALTLVYAGRLCRALTSGERPGALAWSLPFAFALASAYSHYFAAMSAFCCMVALLVACLDARVRLGDRGPLLRFCLLALACVGAYLPWVGTVAGQVSAVSAGYWIEFKFPETLYEFLQFPLRNEVYDSLVNWCHQGELWQFVTRCLFDLFWACGVIALLAAARRACIASVCRHAQGLATGEDSSRPPSPEGAVPASRPASPAVRALCDPAVMAAVALFGTTLFAGLASLAIHQSILQPRYLSVASGAMALLFSSLLARAGLRGLTVAAVLSYAALGGITQHWSVRSDYDWHNGEAVSYYERVTHDSDGNALPVYCSGNLGGNICVAGPLSQLCPDATITIPDYAPAFEAFSPTVRLVFDPVADLGDYHGEFVYLSKDDLPGEPRSFAAMSGATIIETRAIWRPYRSNVWTITLMRR